MELNGGFKSHLNCTDHNCLSCNAAPPCLSNKVVKNLAESFCKVKEGELEKRLLKKGRINDLIIDPALLQLPFFKFPLLNLAK